jgi:hypothetical protein
LSITGMHCIWIGVGDLKPSSSILRNR